VTSQPIALDTSAILAIALDEPEAEAFKKALRGAPILIGWPTLFETRLALAAKGFFNAGAIVAGLVEAPNVSAVAFDRKHFEKAEAAFERFGKGRHPAALDMGDCLAYAVAAVAKAPLLFKGREFGQTDLAVHSASAVAP
jgi:ribonuclease VapC